MGDDAIVPDNRVRKKPFILFRIVQSVTFAFMTLCLLVVLTDLRKLDAPGAPVAYLYLCIAVSALAALIHLPAIFYRLPRKVKWGAHIAILPVLVLFGDYTGAMQSAYVRTPKGAKEAAQRAQADRSVASDKARQAANAKARQESIAQEEAEQKSASAEAQKPELCKMLVDQVVDGEKVLEINNVTVETSFEPNETFTCSGDAVTALGAKKIEFGLVSTPQGKTLVSIRYP